MPGPELASFTEKDRHSNREVSRDAISWSRAGRRPAGSPLAGAVCILAGIFTPWISVTMQFVSRLIEFATNHYLLVAALLVLLVLLLLHELRKGGKTCRPAS